MPFDNDSGALRDILRQINLAEQFTRDQNYEKFQEDILRLYAVTRCLEIISEASRRLSEPLKARHPRIAWKEMAGAGNVYRHNYEDVAARRVWETVQLSLPPLRTAVESELSSMG
jgi:uncharacterized protein with HEPN domain